MRCEKGPPHLIDSELMSSGTEPTTNGRQEKRSEIRDDATSSHAAHGAVTDRHNFAEVRNVKRSRTIAYTELDAPSSPEDRIVSTRQRAAIRPAVTAFTRKRSVPPEQRGTNGHQLSRAASERTFEVRFLVSAGELDNRLLHRCASGILSNETLPGAGFSMPSLVFVLK